ncbi:MAG: hypothetical protein IIC55_04985, partial [Proteobacteria bacterium]|nr:hypothetical protein [Pseudomonadota bacterium]
MATQSDQINSLAAGGAFWVDAFSGGSVFLPDGFTLFPAIYEIDGRDLVLTATNGARFTVRRFLDRDNPPTLVSKDGLEISGDIAANLASETTNQGGEDTTVSFDIGPVLTDGSEAQSITLIGLPQGASLPVGIVTVNSNGTSNWTLTPDQVSGLTITLPASAGTAFTLLVEVTSNDGANISTSRVLVNIDEAAGTLNLTLVVASNDGDDVQAFSVDSTSDQSGGFTDDEAAILLNFSALVEDLDDFSALSIVIGDVPTGATLSAGTDNGDGSWTLTGTQLTGLTIT